MAVGGFPDLLAFETIKAVTGEPSAGGSPLTPLLVVRD
jgi:hypothetical protein